MSNENLMVFFKMKIWNKLLTISIKFNLVYVIYININVMENNIDSSIILYYLKTYPPIKIQQVRNKTME